MSNNLLEKNLTANRVVLNYAETPSGGAPLVLLHGGSSRWQSFSGIIPALNTWHVYAPDFRGHGKSGRTPGHYRLQDYADDMIAFLQEVVGQSAFLFGHSLGGIVALLVAAQYPDGVRAVVVGDAPLTKETWGAAMAPGREGMIATRAMVGGQKSFEELIEFIKELPIPSPDGKGMVTHRELFGEEWGGWIQNAIELYQNDPDMLTAILERFDDTATGYEMENVLPAIRCPVLLLQADPNVGGAMTDEEVERALKLLTSGEHVRLEGIGHGLFFENREKVVGVTREFFGRW